MDLGNIVIPRIEDIDQVLDMGAEPIKVIKEATLLDGGQYDFSSLPIIEGFGSSNVVDTDNDTFHEEALKSLCLASAGMNTWTNHSFDLPYDLMGSLQESPTYKYAAPGSYTGAIKPDKDNWAGVWIKSDVELENPQAALLYKFLKKGRRLGWSVGCQYIKYRRKNDARGAVKGFDVYEVRPIEWSVVGVPANQCSWIESTKSFLIRKGVLPAGENDPEMAYVFKHWDQFGVDAPKIRALADEMFNRYGLVFAEPATGKRMSWPGVDHAR